MKYEGHREGKSPAGYELFRVFVDRSAPASASGLVGDVPLSPSAVAAAPVTCEQCGYVEPDNAVGYPNEIPF